MPQHLWVREHGKKIGGGTTVDGFTKVFTFLGLNSPEKEQELGKQLDVLAYQDFNVANSAGEMLHCLKRALDDVQKSLGDGGFMYPENIPIAAALLDEYGSEFESMEEQAAQAAKQIRDLVEKLK